MEKQWNKLMNVLRVIINQTKATSVVFFLFYVLSLNLYSWNLQMSSALFECSAVCEVIIRNAISNAIQAIGIIHS